MSTSRCKLRKVHLIYIVLCGFSLILIIKSFEWKNAELNNNSNLYSSATSAKENNQSVAANTFITDTDSSSKATMRRFPYTTDPVCRNFSLGLFEDDTFQLTGLVSFPGSGNTWTRHLIQLATGVYTGSYYFDVELYAGGFLGEKEAWYSGRTIVQKFHEKYSKSMYLEKAILLIREPYPAILSFANYLEGGHTKRAIQLPYHHKDWPYFLLQSAYNWLSLAKNWTESPVSLLVIHYEELRSQPVTNVEKMCKFLNHSCPHLRSPCLESKLEGTFRRADRLNRSPVKDATRLDRYPPSVQAVINKGIDHLDQLLRDNGLQPLPLHLYKYYSRPE